jgi:hypothetical protein
MALTDLPQDLEKQQAITADIVRYIWHDQIKPLVSDELIAEHRDNPLGKHSPQLDMVLTFVRSDPLPSEPRLVVVILKPEEEWGIGEHSRVEGVSIRVRPGVYTSVEEIEHAIFLERLKAAGQAFAD